MKALLKFTRHYQTKIFFILISTTYWLTRLTNLTIIPIFTDEAIYLRWSQIGSIDPDWRCMPLVDGKPPLFHWIVMFTIRLFSNPLVAGRLVSVIAGFFNLIGITLLTKQLTKNSKIALLSSILYLTSPFFFVYDRLAIVDNLLTTFSIYSLLFAIALVNTRRLVPALALGATIGAGLLTKASGLFFLLLTPLTTMLQLTQFVQIKKHRLTLHLKAIIIWGSLLFISALLGELIFNSLRLSKLFFRIEQKNYEFIIPFSEFFRHPFAMTWGNLKSLLRWQIGYLTLPVSTLVILSLSIKQYFKEKALLFLYFFLPLLAIASFNKIIFARFLLFSHPFLLILAAIGLDLVISKIKSLSIKTLTLTLALTLPAYTNFLLLTNPLQAPIPQADRDQYLDSWPAGWGITEIVSFLKNQADQEPIHIGTQGTFGLMPYAIEIYLAHHPNVSITSYWPVDTIPDEITAIATAQTTYFIYNELEDIPPQDNLELIMEFKKQRLDEVRHLRLFKVNPLEKIDL